MTRIRSITTIKSRSAITGWLCLFSAAVLSGCTTRTLDSIASAMAITTQSERAQERAELQALAEKSATAEKTPQLETEAAYLQVVAQLQGKQLWFASFAHLDVLESKWAPSDASQLLRADALRHMGLAPESQAIYQKLVSGTKAGKALHGLGLLAAQSKHYELAVRQLSAARDLTPTDAVLLSDLGFALLNTAQAAAARIPLMQAAQLQPANVRIQSNVALYLVLHGEGQDAAAWMHQHQMNETQRTKVFQLAQQLASVPTSSASSTENVVPAADAAPIAQVPVIPSRQLETLRERLPEPPPANSVRTAGIAVPLSQWMTETTAIKEQP
jgi:Flp pilus assembly protein TadD